MPPFLLAGLSWVRGVGWKVPIIVSLAILSVAVINQVLSDRDQRKALTVSLRAAEADTALVVTARKADATAINHKNVAIAAIRAKEAKGYAATEAALEANSDWASQPVPAAVLDSLRQ